MNYTKLINYQIINYLFLTVLTQKLVKGIENQALESIYKTFIFIKGKLTSSEQKIDNDTLWISYLNSFLRPFLSEWVAEDLANYKKSKNFRTELEILRQKTLKFLKTLSKWGVIEGIDKTGD